LFFPDIERTPEMTQWTGSVSMKAAGTAFQGLLNFHNKTFI
jgi:hypothetical protein